MPPSPGTRCACPTPSMRGYKRGCARARPWRCLPARPCRRILPTPADNAGTLRALEEQLAALATRVEILE
jgi:hypothetical protein